MHDIKPGKWYEMTKWYEEKARKLFYMVAIGTSIIDAQPSSWIYFDDLKGIHAQSI